MHVEGLMPANLCAVTLLSSEQLDVAKMDLLAGAHLCHHNKPGTWNSVSADQFGEQTYIKKGNLRCLGFEWINHVRRPSGHLGGVCGHVTLAIKSMYSDDDETKEEKRKEKWE